MSGTEHRDRQPGQTDLAALPREMAPPPELEDRTVAALRAEGLLRTGSRTSGSWFPRLAAALLLIAAGLAVGRWSADVEGEQPGYVLLLRGGPAESRPTSHEEMSGLVAEYAAWAMQTRQDGFLLGGEKLTDEGRLLQPDGAGIERRFAAEGELEGYFLLRAMPAAEAARIAAGCPHLRHGGTVELREIHRFDS